MQVATEGDADSLWGGAGGDAGLLAVVETGTEGTPEYWFLYDGTLDTSRPTGTSREAAEAPSLSDESRGNGNVGQVLDASDQSVDAQKVGRALPAFILSSASSRLCVSLPSVFPPSQGGTKGGPSTCATAL